MEKSVTKYAVRCACFGKFAYVRTVSGQVRPNYSLGGGTEKAHTLDQATLFNAVNAYQQALYVATRLIEEKGSEGNWVGLPQVVKVRDAGREIID